MSFNNNVITSKGIQKNELEKRYLTLSGKRETFLTRGRDMSSYTLPNLLPRTLNHGGDLGTGANQYGWSNIGAQAASHLANKMTNTLFPIQHNFFALEFSTDAEQKLAAAGIEKSELNQSLVYATYKAKEREKELEGRVALYSVMEHLIVAGNVLFIDLDDKMQAIPMDRYVVRRDRANNLQELIIKESKDIGSFPKNVQAIVKPLMKRSTTDNRDAKANDATLYTSYELKDDVWIVKQELEGVPVTKDQTIPKGKERFWALQWKRNYGEDYGRGLVEMHAGDFFVISFLSEAIVKGMALMSDVKYLIRPGSMIDIEEFMSAPVGEALYGNEGDITVMQLDKYADFTPIAEVLEVYKQRIGQAFLMKSAFRRDAERVTTVELRMDAAELEGGLGGTYSHLDVTLQTPYSKMLLQDINFDMNKLGLVPVIKTGMEALSKAGELDKIYQFSEAMQLPAAWPEGAQAAIDWGEYMSEAATTLNMKVPWIKSKAVMEQEAADRAKQEQEAMAANALAQGASKALPDMMKEQ